ncbi:helix-turn-helix transcriptional regulator [Sphingomonas sp. ID0503]|uniref:helix-turn-helix transcriptional regulator n=1 Tax=Sphingomonas sp. ID0503 TaxID=3399691 RepID=UPI003AFB47D9
MAAAIAGRQAEYETDILIPLEEVERLAGIKKSKIYQLVRAKEFPPPYKAGGSSSRWSRAEVIAWRAQLRPISMRDPVRV